MDPTEGRGSTIIKDDELHGPAAPPSGRLAGDRGRPGLRDRPAERGSGRADDRNKLKLGKGSYFVKTRLRQLEQEDDTWEADFFPVPSPDARVGDMWLGLVLSHAHDNVLAHLAVREPPGVNDLARLLADAMRRPLTPVRTPAPRPSPPQPGGVVRTPAPPEAGRHRGRVPGRAAEGGTRRSATCTPKSNRSTERGASPPRKQARSEPAPATRKRQPARGPARADVRLYTLDVFLPGRPVGRSFFKKKSGVSRVIQIRGDQTLEDLHDAIFDAFDRDDEHLYEFQLGRGPKDHDGPTYGSPELEDRQVGVAGETTIESLGLRKGRSFGYLFDFGDNWWHQINVDAVEDAVPDGQFPRVTKRVGKSPPQYPDDEE